MTNSREKKREKQKRRQRCYYSHVSVLIGREGAKWQEEGKDECFFGEIAIAEMGSSSDRQNMGPVSPHKKGKRKKKGSLRTVK